MDAKKIVFVLVFTIMFLFVVNVAVAAPPEDQHCPEGGTKFDSGEGNEVIDGVVIDWSGHHVEVSNGEAEICVKAGTENSEKFWLSGGWDVDWTNDGGQIPDISYLVVYQVQCPTPEPTPTNTPEPSPTPTEPPTFLFDFEWQANCQHVGAKAHNLSDVEIGISGNVWAQPVDGDKVVIGEMPPGSVCPIDGWCGPEETLGDWFTDFQGTVGGELELSFNGEVIETQSFGPETLNCAPQPTPTVTQPPGWNFEWSQDINCVQPWLRVKNINQVDIHVEGEIWAANYLVSRVPPQYQEVPPGEWGGPEGDMPELFVGTVTEWIEISYQGQLIVRKDFSEELNCTIPDTPTPTATNPPPTQTGTPPPNPTITAIPTQQETPKPEVQPAPNTGVEDNLLPIIIVCGVIIFLVIGLPIYFVKAIIRKKVG